MFASGTFLPIVRGANRQHFRKLVFPTTLLITGLPKAGPVDSKLALTALPANQLVPA